MKTKAKINPADSPLEKGMPFWDHLRDLRKCIFRAGLAVVAGFGLAYAFSKTIFRVLRAPYDEAYEAVFDTLPVLINTGLLEGFIVYLKVALISGLFLASPVVFYQVWKFIAPGLKPKERRHVFPFVSMATLLFVGGALFGYFVVFPPSFQFFLQITQGEQIEATIRMREYFDLASWMLIAFGLAFEAPLIVLYLVYFRILTPQDLVKTWRGVIIGIALASALITPTPDVGTMLMMALPLTGLYGLTILLSRLVARPSGKELQT